MRSKIRTIRISFFLIGLMAPAYGFLVRICFTNIKFIAITFKSIEHAGIVKKQETFSRSHRALMIYSFRLIIINNLESYSNVIIIIIIDANLL